MISSMIDRRTVHHQVVEIPIAGARLPAQLTTPTMARGLVILAGGDGEHLYTRGNEIIAAELASAGFSTLVLELLTPEEMVEDAESSELRFNQTLIAARLVRVISWAREQLVFVGLEIGCVAGGLCAGSALAAAAVMPDVHAIVCRGARFERADALIDRVHASVLLLVGGLDSAHLAQNRRALGRLSRNSQLRMVNDAGHLLDQPLDLERVARESVAWFGRTLVRGSGAARVLRAAPAPLPG